MFYIFRAGFRRGKGGNIQHLCFNCSPLRIIVLYGYLIDIAVAPLSDLLWFYFRVSIKVDAD